jgi:endonuclease G
MVRDEAVWFEGMITRELMRGVRGVGALRTVLADRALANAGFDLLRRREDEAVDEELLARARAVAERIAQDGEGVPLSEADHAALEVFVLLVARPALFVQNGEPKGRPANWCEIERDTRHLREVIAGVGRIQKADGTRVGTGCLVGDRLLLTNNHVVSDLLDLGQKWKVPDYGLRCSAAGAAWRLGPAPMFELHGEVGLERTCRAKIVGVRAHHAHVDMALLELEQDPADSRRLVLAAEMPANVIARRIYAIGYPGALDRATPSHMFARVFGDEKTLGAKRFSPGAVIGWLDEKLPEQTLLHDASTLPGSSGSCIVDFEEGEVIGLHFGGSFARERNRAVPLWKYRNDPWFAKNGVTFGEH